MKQIKWTDENGYKRIRLVLDNEQNIEYGIPLEPPPVDELIDWDEVKRDLHNQLMNRGLLSYEMLGGSNDNHLQGAVLSALKPKVIRMFKEANNG